MTGNGSAILSAAAAARQRSGRGVEGPHVSLHYQRPRKEFSDPKFREFLATPLRMTNVLLVSPLSGITWNVLPA